MSRRGPTMYDSLRELQFGVDGMALLVVESIAEGCRTVRTFILCGPRDCNVGYCRGGFVHETGSFVATRCFIVDRHFFLKSVFIVLWAREVFLVVCMEVPISSERDVLNSSVHCAPLLIFSSLAASFVLSHRKAGREASEWSCSVVQLLQKCEVTTPSSQISSQNKFRVASEPLASQLKNR